LEPASCAIHGLDKLRPKIGVEVLLFGAGPTGLILAQLLKQNGARRVVIAAPAGMKMELAKKLNAGDEYVELVRGDKDAQAKQWAELKKNNPCKWSIASRCSPVVLTILLQTVSTLFASALVSSRWSTTPSTGSDEAELFWSTESTTTTPVFTGRP
jgi:threonine dehydrogenase-like Zn-dependent dehydrogenase